jgi:cation-transporting ATPase 13A1
MRQYIRSLNTKHFSITGDVVTPASAHYARKFQQRSSLHVRRRFQFSSALKRMSSVSTMATPRTHKTFVAVKGAPETLQRMFRFAPNDYEEIYKFFTRRGSRVLALGYKYMKEDMTMDEVYRWQNVDPVPGDTLTHICYH